MGPVAESTTKQLSLLDRFRIWVARPRIIREERLRVEKSVAASLGILVIKAEEIRGLLDDFNEQFYLATQHKRGSQEKNAFTGVKVPADPHPEEQPGIFMQSDGELAMLEVLEGLKGRRGPEVTLDDPLDDEDLGLPEE